MPVLGVSRLLLSAPGGWWGSRIDGQPTGRTQASSVLDLIGNTPLVDLSALSRQKTVRLFGKLEASNPGGSVKDRPALQMLSDALSDGTLKPGMTILEATSGNTGTALAFLGRCFGFGVELVVPEITSEAKCRDIERFGAKLRKVPGHTTESALEVAYSLGQEYPGTYFLTDQYTNLSNPKAHYLSTAPEIVRDCPDVTHVVSAQGSFGTLGGLARYLREKTMPVELYAVVAKPGVTTIFGMKEATAVMPLVNDSVLAGRTMVDASAASHGIHAGLSLGYHLGPSAGAVLAAAIKLTARIPHGSQVVCVLADGGVKYPSSRLYPPFDVGALNIADGDHHAFTQW